MTAIPTLPGSDWISSDSSFAMALTDNLLLLTDNPELQSTPNASTTPSDIGSKEQHLSTVALVLLPLVLVCGLVGNALVCIAVFRFAPLRIVANYFIVSLAVADMAVCGIVMPMAAFQELLGDWRLGVILCDLWVCLDVLMSTASIWNLCVIALDRYMAITRPVWYALRRTPLMAAVAITSAWVLSVLVSIPALLFVGGYDETTAHECVLNISPVFAIISSMVSFYIPCVVVLIVYQRIFVAARHHSRRRVRPAIVSVSTVQGATEKPPTPSGNNASSSNSTPSSRGLSNANNNASTSHSDGQGSTINLDSNVDCKHQVDQHEKENGNGHNQIDSSGSGSSTMQSDTPKAKKRVTLAPIIPVTRDHQQILIRRRHISVSRERRAAFVLAIVVGVFICCWLPFFIINVLLGVCPTCYVSPVAFQVVTWLGWCNSILNPIIYTTFNREFRNAFRKILFCGKI
ncbi:probable G-protein coupled receptor No18 [Diadema antillarum]|uniref:probable G-protein coupled receptor No18 n=1 Tax=Diadema antillarum TaxID=105358 RepID=UPI003A854663